MNSGRKRVLGITGGVGAGKSTVLAYLRERYHARVWELDKAAHELMKKGNPIYEQILETFGSEILEEDSREISHRKLYQKTFGQKKELERLNAIVHPAVKAEVCRRIAGENQNGESSFVVLEAALLLEDHYEVICDEIWYVSVREEVRRERLIRSRGYSPEKIREILNHQKSDEDFRAGCQYVIDNSSDFLENTYEQIDRGLREHGFL